MARCRATESGLTWDVITLMDLRASDRGAAGMRITGLVHGDEGALVLVLPGAIEGHYAMRPDEARALRDALARRLSDDPPDWCDDWEYAIVQAGNPECNPVDEP